MGFLLSGGWVVRVIVRVLICPTLTILACPFVFLGVADAAAVHAFPTRRSSDLSANGITLSNGTSLFGIATGAALNGQIVEIGRAHGRTPLTQRYRMPSSAWTKETRLASAASRTPADLHGGSSGSASPVPGAADE